MYHGTATLFAVDLGKNAMKPSFGGGVGTPIRFMWYCTRFDIASNLKATSTPVSLKLLPLIPGKGSWQTSGSGSERRKYWP